jgi:hypothetical protein
MSVLLLVDRERFSVLKVDHWVQNSDHLCDAGYIGLNCVVLTSQCSDVGHSELISSTEGTIQKFRMKLFASIIASYRRFLSTDVFWE